MAVHIQERKRPMLYSDLFKTHRNDMKEEERSSIISPSPSPSPNQPSSCDSSISGSSSPFDSETASSESSDDANFMAELTRQMAECMLQDEEEEEEEKKEQQQNNHENQGYMDSVAAAISNLKYPMYQNPVRVDDRMPPLEVYELKNQPPARKQGPVCRVKGTNSAHKKQIHKTEHHINNSNNKYIQMQYGGATGRKRHSAGGSGMRAVFLGGSKPASGSSGTGVFLPRVANDPVELKKKSGCSMVLIPTRVLQTLELHFNKFSDSVAPPPVISGRYSSTRKDEGTGSSGQQSGAQQMDNWPATQNDAAEEMQLPQEWTY